MSVLGGRLKEKSWYVAFVAIVLVVSSVVVFAVLVSDNSKFEVGGLVTGSNRIPDRIDFISTSGSNYSAFPLQVLTNVPSPGDYQGRYKIMLPGGDYRTTVLASGVGGIPKRCNAGNVNIGGDNNNTSILC